MAGDQISLSSTPVFRDELNNKRNPVSVCRTHARPRNKGAPTRKKRKRPFRGFGPSLPATTPRPQPPFVPAQDPRTPEVTDDATQLEIGTKGLVGRVMVFFSIQLIL
jgi:hypothetical protein